MTAGVRALLAGCALLAAAGCVPVGRDFIRPAPERVEIGTTTPEEVRAKFGPPRSERTWARGDLEIAKEIGAPFGAPRVGGSMTELYYYYENRGGVASVQGVEPSRSAHFWFWNGRLAGYRSSSSFKADSTGFDEAKAAAVKPWQTLRANLIAALGEPSGRRAYPLAPAPEMEILTWFSFEYDTSMRQSRAHTFHALVNGIGVVVDVRLDSSAKPFAPAPAPAYNPVPIYIPPPKKK